MMNEWEIKRALDDKADNYKVHDLENKLRHIQSDNNELSNQVSHLQHQVNTQREALRHLLEVLINNGSMCEDIDQFMNIQNMI